MKVLLKKATSVAAGRIVLLFGCGLIGSRILRELECNQAECVLALKAAWRDAEAFRKQCLEVDRTVRSLANSLQLPVHFVWSAGSGSFSSTEEILRHEDKTFAEALSLMRSMAEAAPCTFHFISSAGGLFEGQRLVGPETTPEPVRPYGLMKLRQENELSGLADQAGFKARIYRPSTVYGTREFGFRTGLVSHLFWNALRNVPTTLEANFHALRDYVHASDIAAYITGQVLFAASEQRLVHFLVSGKPSSIFEIAGRVERMLGRALVLRYSDRVQNDRDITFRADVMPDNWRPHDLETGLRSVFRNTSFLYLRDFPYQLEANS